MKKTKILLVGSLLLGTIIFSQGLSETKKVSAEEVDYSLNEITYDFSASNGLITDFSKWGSTYSKHEVNIQESNNFPKSKITFEKANKQGTTITNYPVTKGNYVEFNLLNSNYYIEKATFTCKQWNTNKQTITLNVSNDNVNYKKTNSKSSNFELSSDSFTSENNYIGLKYTFSSTSNQVGIQSLSIKLGKKVIDENKCYIDFEGASIPSQTIDKGALIEKPADPTKEGYVFDGWYFGDTEWDFNTPVTSSKMTLTAHWKEKVTNIADVIAKASGTFIVEGEVVGKQNASGCSIQDATGAILVYDTACSVLKTGNNVKLKGTYYTYNGNPQLKSVTIISYDNDNTINTLPIIDTNEINKKNTGKYVSLNNLKINGSVTTSKNNKTVKVLNKDFVLWYTDTSTVKGEEYLTNGAYVNVEGYIQMYNNTIQILVTNITKANIYTITYNSLGGTSVASQTVGEGEKFTKPTDPTKTSTEYEEYQFGGWYLDENCSDGKEFNFDNNVTGSVVVYAKWNVTKKSVSTKFTSVETKASLGFDYTETITKGEEEFLTSTFIGNNIEKPFTVSGHSYSKGTNSLINSTSYIEFEIENELTDEISITFSGTSSNHSKIKFVSYDDNRNVIETSVDYTLETSHTNIACALNKYENVKYIRLEVSSLADNDTINFTTYQLLTLAAKTTKSYSDFRNVMMQFRYEFDTSKFEDVSSIGIALTKNTEFNFEQQGLETLPENIKLYETKKDNGTDYNTSLTIGVKNIPTNAYNTSLVAVAYVKTIDGKYYFAKKSTYSVNKMIETYIDTLDTNTEMYKILEAFFDSLQ